MNHNTGGQIAGKQTTLGDELKDESIYLDEKSNAKYYQTATKCIPKNG